MVPNPEQVSGGHNATLRYDPLGRLYEIEDGSGNIERLLYDGHDLVAEYNASGAIIARYVHGVGGGDDPLVAYSGSNADRNNAEFLYADRLGSIVAAFNRSGGVEAINAYDEFGVPGDATGSTNTGRFRYTGQIWIPELGQYHYKARAYSPSLGRFMQTDPIGYADGLNMYAYVGNEPINGTDFFGLSDDDDDDDDDYQAHLFVHGFTVRDVSFGSGDTLGGGGGGSRPRFTGLDESRGCAACNAVATKIGNRVVVTAPKPKPYEGLPDGSVPTYGRPQREEEPSTLEKAGQCALDQAGLGELGSAAAAASGAPVLPTRGKPAGAVPGTSVASRVGSAIHGSNNAPVRLPTLTGFPGVGSGVNVRFTASAARIVGRGIPVVGWALLAYDAGSIAYCTFSGE